jgi:hypothetical protein
VHTKTCTKCGHACHCDKVNCPECINDVCGHCNCESKTLAEHESKIWPWQDSGVEQML